MSTEAAEQQKERRGFLINSLGQAVSFSTEILKDMVVSLYDGAKQIVGRLTGNIEVRRDLPDPGFAPKDGGPRTITVDGKEYPASGDTDPGFAPKESPNVQSATQPKRDLSPEEVARIVSE